MLPGQTRNFANGNCGPSTRRSCDLISCDLILMTVNYLCARLFWQAEKTSKTRLLKCEKCKIDYVFSNTYIRSQYLASVILSLSCIIGFLVIIIIIIQFVHTHK